MMRSDLSGQIFKTTTAPKDHVTTGWYYFYILVHVSTCYLLFEIVEIKSFLCEPYLSNAALTRQKKLKYGSWNYRIIDLSLWSPSANASLNNVVPNSFSTQMYSPTISAKTEQPL